MATSLSLCLLSTWLLFSTAVADDCDGYVTSSGIYKWNQDCSSYQFCCGSCDDRYCCSNFLKKLNEDFCELDSSRLNPIAIGSLIGGVIFMIVIFIVCCVCPCCCLYKMCRKPRPVVTTSTHTTVISSQYPQQQPANPGPQYAGYQSVPAQPGYSSQPGYGGQPMLATPYQGQPYAPGPPPPYHESGPGYPVPYSQAAYDGGHPPYPLQPPTQPGYAHPPQPTDYSAAQPPYNPAYVEPPKTGY